MNRFVDVRRKSESLAKIKKLSHIYIYIYMTVKFGRIDTIAQSD